jgi:hypothetical protein
MITFLSEPWKYQNFIDVPFIYLDNDLVEEHILSTNDMIDFFAFKYYLNLRQTRNKSKKSSRMTHVAINHN